MLDIEAVLTLNACADKLNSWDCTAGGCTYPTILSKFRFQSPFPRNAARMTTFVSGRGLHELAYWKLCWQTSMTYLSMKLRDCVPDCPRIHAIYWTDLNIDIMCSTIARKTADLCMEHRPTAGYRSRADTQPHVQPG